MRGVQVCHFWREGRCTRGVDCKFSHSDESNDGSSASSELTYLTQRTRSLNSTPARLTRNTGSIITTIKRVSLDNLPLRADAPITITGFQFAASYNLVWTKSLSIMVPGCPPIWSPPPMPIKLKADNHKTLIGRAQYQTQVSMAPVLAALSVSITDTSTLPSIDLITDRNSLRKLLDFVNGKVGQTWKIDVELVRNTMIFAKNAEGISRHKSDGYGFPFEAAFLKYPEELKGTSEHHRIATYDIGGMKWMVRFEADGCYDAQSTEGLSQSPGTPGTLRSSSEIEEATYKNIKIHKTATAISTLPILEVKTAKLNRSPKRSQWMPQLYFSQTNHLIIANHDDGIFDHANIKESDQTENMRQWEQENQGMLQKLLHLIGMIKNTIGEVEGRKATLLCKRGEKKDEICVLEQKELGLMLDEKMITQLWGSPAMPMP